MKQWLQGALVIVGLVFAVGTTGHVIWTIARSGARAADFERERCRKFRREFFESCLAAEPRYRCEAQWAQLGGKVFDSDPVATYSDQLDCSGKFE